MDASTMRNYRIAALNNRRATYGEDAALAWEVEAKVRHEAAKLLYHSMNDPRSPRRVALPDKSAKPQYMADDRGLGGANCDVRFTRYKNT